MNNRKSLYYKLEYIIPSKDGEGHIKIKLDFNARYMSYTEIDVSTNDVITSIFIKGYDYKLAVDVLCDSYYYRSNFSSIDFF